jgi:PBSX family phage terminase large subunit
LINNHTGNWFRGLGMDKPENAKAIEGANIAWMNECNQFELDDYDFLDTTIRAENNCEISMIMDWNPESKSHWLYDEHLALQSRAKCLVLKSTFWDNYLIDRQELHNKLLEIKKRGIEGERRYKVWGLGEWGIEDPNKLFARNFDRDRHVSTTIAYKDEYDIYLAFDLNYDPTCLVIQIQGNNLYILEEYHEKGMTLPFLLRHIKEKYKNSFFIINGDASGHYSRNLTDNSTSYEIIKNSLNLSWDNFNVPKANPSHKRTRQLTNIMFSFHNTLIHYSCNNLIADLESVEVDERESIDEYKKKHPEMSHWLDAFRYHLFAQHNNKATEIGI